MPLPGPYVPLEPEKPKRREWFLNKDQDGRLLTFSHRVTEDSILVREVLHDDPTPEAVQEVARELRDRGVPHLADKLEGK